MMIDQFHIINQYRFFTESQLMPYAALYKQQYASPIEQFHKYQSDFESQDFKNFFGDPHLQFSLFVNDTKSYPYTFFLNIDKKGILQGEISVEQHQEQPQDHASITFQIYNIKQKEFVYGRKIFRVCIFNVELAQGAYLFMLRNNNHQSKFVRFSARERNNLDLQLPSVGNSLVALRTKIFNIKSTVLELIQQHEIDIIESMKHKYQHNRANEKQLTHTIIEMVLIVVANIAQIVYINRLFAIQRTII